MLKIFINGYRDYDDALAELEVARQTLPNDARVFQLTGEIQRRQGHWQESTRSLERSVELNPRDIETLRGAPFNYNWLRRYADQKSALARALTVFPNDIETRLAHAGMEVDQTADTRPLHEMLDSIRATNPAAMPHIADSWLWCAVAERDATAAKNALDHVESPILGDEALLSRSFLEGFIARMTKDEGKARSDFVAARAEQEKIVQAQPNNVQRIVRAWFDRCLSGAERGSTTRRPACSRASSCGKRRSDRSLWCGVSGIDRCLDWR